MYLEKINGPEDVKKIKIDELPVLAQEFFLNVTTEEVGYGTRVTHCFRCTMCPL